MNQIIRSPILFAGSSHPALAEKLSNSALIPLGAISLGRFPDGEISVEIGESVHGRDVFVLQSIARSPDSYLTELLIIIDALRRSSAKSITAIVPYFGYCRQDRKDKPGVPITAKLVANLITTAGATRLITVDFHAGQLEGFFEIPVDHLRCQRLLAQEVSQRFSSQCLVVAPDIGSIKIAKQIAKELKTDFVVAHKERLSPTETRINLIGSVVDRDALIVDDICSTAETLTIAAGLCSKGGARRIFGAVTHGICAQHSLAKIESSELEWLLMTDTLSCPYSPGSPSKKLCCVSVAPLIAEALKRINLGTQW